MARLVQVKLTLTHEEIAEIIGRLGDGQPLVLAVQEEQLVQ